MHPIRVDGGLLDTVIERIASCGSGRRECVSYVTGPVDVPDRATGLIHPRHRATAASTTVGSDELDAVWDRLRERRETIVMQVHSHPGAAHHSGTDDRWPIIHRKGFLSLVLAHFGLRGLVGAHLAVFLGDGQWQTVGVDAWDRHLTMGQPHRSGAAGHRP